MCFTIFCLSSEILPLSFGQESMNIVENQCSGADASALFGVDSSKALIESRLI